MITEYPHRMKIRSVMRRRGSAEDGYVLVAVMFLMAILVLGLAVAAPRIKQELQRDREEEAIHRGKQYIRAIQLYYRKFHAYPPNLDALEKANDLRFLRKKYVDPITRKDDWHPILFGQNKVPTVIGFFGAELGGTSIAGIGPGGAGSGTAAGVSPSSPSAIPGAGPGATGSAPPGATNGQTFGGAGIIGFSIPSEQRSILIYKKQDHFDHWEFVYDPRQESVNGAAPNSGGGTGTPGSPTGDQPAPGGPGGRGPIDRPWGPNGNLPPPVGPGSQGPTNGPWSPNGNLPTPPPE